MAALQKKYMAFIDESGVADLNSPSSAFILSCVIIDKQDYDIIEGYFRLIKRQFLGDDFKQLHATDLFERPEEFYPELDVKTNNFITDLSTVFRAIPYEVRLFHVDKDKLREKLGHTPGKGKTLPAGVNPEIAYEMTSKQAFNDFAAMLVNKNAQGEIVIESRLYKDAQFILSFDEVRKKKAPDGTLQPLHAQIKKRITSVQFANKHQHNVGLEIADMCAYIGYRHKYGDPGGTVVVAPTLIGMIYSSMKDHIYQAPSEKQRGLFHDVAN